MLRKLTLAAAVAAMAAPAGLFAQAANTTATQGKQAAALSAADKELLEPEHHLKMAEDLNRAVQK